MTHVIFGFSSERLLDVVRVLSFEIIEELARPYAITVFLHAPDDQYTEVEELVGEDGTLEIRHEDGSVRARFHGVVVASEFVHALSHHLLFRVELRPRVWKLSLGEKSRVWVDKKIPEVIEDVLKSNGLSRSDYTLSLSRTYPVQEHITQYHESDWDFLCRRMEREGIFFLFEQADDKEKLLLTDDLAVLTRSPEAPVRLFAISDGDVSASEALHSFSHRHATVPQKFQVADYNYLTPSTDIRASNPVVDGGVGTVSVFGGNHPTVAEARRLARVRAEERAAPQVRYHGRGRVFELRAGYRFEVDEHPVTALNREYLALRVEHRGADLAQARHFAEWIDTPGLHGALDRAVYSAEVSAQHSDTPYRAPVRTRVPKVAGLESARVDGPAESDYAQIDEHGRYHVKILFDESGLKDGRASTWVRMMQPHGGEPEGFHFPLRKGTEVLLAFLGGDPDRPIIVGVGPDAEHPSPVTQSNASQNVIMTGGRNRIEIEDQDGSQYVGVYSPTQNSTLHLGAHQGPYHQGHNFTLTTDGNGLIHTGGERNITVGAKQTEDVQGDLIEDYHATQTTHVFGAFKETIDGGATQTISAGEKRTVTGGVTETISGGETRTINGGQTETVNGSVTRSISSSLSDTISGSVTTQVTGNQSETISGSLSQSVTGAVSISTPSTMTINATAGMNVTATGGCTFAAPGGITMIDGCLDGRGGIKNEYYPRISAIVGIQLDGCGLSQEANGFKLDVAINAFSATGVENVEEVFKIEKWSDVVNMVGVFLITAAVIIKD